LSVSDYIARVTTNDESLFYDKLPEEILESIKNKVRDEEVKKTNAIVNSLNAVQLEKEDIENKYTNISSKMKKIIEIIANFISWGLFGCLVGVSTFLIFFVNTNNIVLKKICFAGSGVIALLGISFGFSLLNIRSYVKNKIYKYLLNYFFSN